jgi:hypothetical protein
MANEDTRRRAIARLERQAALAFLALLVVAWVIQRWGAFAAAGNWR